MGKVYGGVFANWYGKVGNVVGRVRQGRTVLSIYQPNVSNPNTASQQAVRTDFSLMTRRLSPASSFLRVGFRTLDGYNTGNPFSAAVGYNLRQSGMFIGSGVSREVDFSRLTVSLGSVDLPYSPTCGVDSFQVSMTWADNSGLGNAEANDRVMILALCPALGSSFVNTNVAVRSDRNALFTLPTGWAGKEAHLYMAMFRSSDQSVSNSAFLDTITL